MKNVTEKKNLDKKIVVEKNYKNEKINSLENNSELIVSLK